MIRFKPVILSIIAGFLAFSCKSTPVPLPRPAVSLKFDHPQATDPDTVKLYFTLRAENPRNNPAQIGLSTYRVFINGTEFNEGSMLVIDGDVINPLSSVDIPVILQLDLKKVPLKTDTASVETSDKLSALLELNLTFAFDGGGKSAVKAAGTAEFQRIQTPIFEISSIMIMQAELINTRFKVKVRISNPNPFPVDLSLFQYELYGAGRFWADGTEKNVFTVAAGESAEKELFLVMNFTNMRRDLLDQVIAMERVRYRFAGTVQIGGGVDYLSDYTADFNLEGESEVTR
jgi:LEA14-like dessication related protein